MRTDPNRLLRSALYVPAGNQRALEKAHGLSADAIILDLEDAVAPECREEARRHVRALHAARAGHAASDAMTVIRVNAVGTPDLAADLEVVAACRPDAVLIPKVRGHEDVAAVERMLGDVAPTPPAVWCMVETLHGLSRIDEIASALASATATCIVLGTNDLCRESGVSPADARRYLVPWLMSVVRACKAHAIPVLDGVWNDFQDVDGFKAEARQGADMGFDGKTLVHPSQVGPANAAFSPSPDDVREAEAIVAAFLDPAHRGKGVVNLAGRMVELLHLEMARGTLARHRLAVLSKARSGQGAQAS